MTFLNIAAYKFIELHDVDSLKSALEIHTADLCGTILLSPEGINIMLAGDPTHIRHFQATLQQDARFSDLHYKEHLSDIKPFQRLKIKLKKEIIAFGIASVNPIQEKAPYIKPKELKDWLENQKDFVLLDTRNEYEVAEGTFQNATHININHFRDFSKAVETLSALKNKTIVTFCTGGIRCEKAALLLQQQGFSDVYQLEGGILEYFNQCGDAFYDGKCYVFDERITI